MCDWDAEEYAEYLLWVEAQNVRAPARVRAAIHGASRAVTEVIPLPPESAAA